MKKEVKDSKSESTQKKSKKGLFIIIGVLVLLIGGGLFFLNKKKNSSKEEKRAKAEKNDAPKKEANLTEQVESAPILDSIITDSNNIANEEIEMSDDEEIDEVLNTISMKNKRKPQLDYENNPKNWDLVKMDADDTSFFIIKNKITGTKLSNRYYSKSQAKEEILKFKKILSR